jgi:hypothetical protein
LETLVFGVRRLDAAFGSVLLVLLVERKRRQAGALQIPCLTLNQIILAGPASVVIAAR